MKKTAPPIAALICGYDTPIIAFANQFTKAVIATALGLKILKYIFCDQGSMDYSMVRSYN